MPALLGILILLIGHIVLNHMRFGRYVTAIGANAEGAAQRHNTKAVTMKVYHQRNGRRAGGMIIPHASAAAPPTGRRL